jgi:hypothetical protein
MKTLYESILDDEDILTGSVKKDIDNPFLLLSLLSEEDKNNEEIVLDIIKQLEFPKYVLQNKEKIPFNKECLGVKTYDSPSGANGYMVTYDREKILKDTPGYRKNWFPPIFLYIKILKNYSSDPNFLMNGKIITELGYNIDMREVFGGVTPVKQLLKRWEKKYKVRAII